MATGSGKGKGGRNGNGGNIDQLEVDLNVMRLERDNLLADNRRLVARVSELEQQLKTAPPIVDSHPPAGEEIAVLRVQVTELEQQKTRLEDVRDTLQESNQNFQKMINDIPGSHRAKSEELEALRIEHDSLKQQFAAKETELATAKAVVSSEELVKECERLQNMEKIMNEACSALEGVAAERDEALGEVTSLNAKLTLANEVLETEKAKSAEVETLRQANLELQHRLDAIVLPNGGEHDDGRESLQTELDTARKDLQQAATERNNAQQSLNQVLGIWQNASSNPFTAENLQQLQETCREQGRQEVRSVTQPAPVPQPATPPVVSPPTRFTREWAQQNWAYIVVAMVLLALLVPIAITHVSFGKTESVADYEAKLTPTPIESD